MYWLNCDSYELFKINIGSQITSSPSSCVFGDLECFVVAGNAGRLHLFDLKTHSELASIQLAGEIFSTPIINNGFVYVGCRDDHLYCLEIQINN